MSNVSTLEMVLRRDRAVVVAGLIALLVLSWGYMFYLAAGMQSMDAGMDVGMRMDAAVHAMHTWGLVDLLLLFVMWAVMMVAMMVPSAAPMVLLFATISRKKNATQTPLPATAVFLGGYLAIWTLFSVAATLVQWGLHEAALLSPHMVSTSSLLGGGLLLVAGVYQWTPWKHACLKHCRSPLDFLATGWRDEAGGVFAMGLRHGLVCLGCCWFLMGLLFVAGVMNLLWVAIIAVFVLIEKLAPGGLRLSVVTGALLIAAGLWLMVGGWSA